MPKKFGDAFTLPEISTPAANPPTGYVHLYVKSDGKLYAKDSTGLEYQVAGSGGGGAVLVPESPTQPATDNGDGSLWYDTDSNEGAGTDVEFIQPTQPDASASPDGILWFDTDDPGTDALVPTTRNVNTGTGLTGGGPLSTDLTLAVDFAPSGTSSTTQAVRADDSRVNGTVATSRLGTGTADATTYLRGDQTWAAVQSDPGIGLANSDRGVWSESTTYSKGDLVTYNGFKYVATVDAPETPVPGNDPLLVGQYISCTTTTFTVPAGVQVGDELLLIVSNYSGPSYTVSGGGAAGWTAVYQGSASSTYVTYSTLYRKVAEAGDIGATITVGGVSSYYSIDFRAYRYAAYDGYAFQADNGVSASSGPSITATGRGTTVHAFASMTNTSGTGTFTMDTSLANQQVTIASNYFVAGSGDLLHSSTNLTVAGKTFTSSRAGGFVTWAISYTSTRTQDPPVFNTADGWSSLPFQATLSSYGEARWVKLGDFSPTAAASNTIGNFQINVPSGFTRLRLFSRRLDLTSGTSSSHLYLQFNSDASASYGEWMGYHTAGAWSGTTTTSATSGYVIYGYFYYGSSYTSTARELECDIYNDGITYASWRARWEQAPSTSAYYRYGSEISGTWIKTDLITTINLYTSAASVWDPNSVVTLYGWAE